MIVKQPPVIFKATGRFQPFGCYKSHVVDRALSVLSDAAASTSKPVEVPRGPAQERTAGKVSSWQWVRGGWWPKRWGAWLSVHSQSEEGPRTFLACRNMAARLRLAALFFIPAIGSCH